MELIRFAHALCRAVYHFAREKYYGFALSHVGHDHVDSLLITNRLIKSQMEVNDFLRRIQH